MGFLQFHVAHFHVRVKTGENPRRGQSTPMVKKIPNRPIRSRLSFPGSSRFPVGGGGSDDLVGGDAVGGGRKGAGGVVAGEAELCWPPQVRKRMELGAAEGESLKGWERRLLRPRQLPPPLLPCAAATVHGFGRRLGD